MRGETFYANGVFAALSDKPNFWLHVHPEHAVGAAEWALVRLARAWREGMLPGAGGVQDQPAATVAGIEIVLAAWGKLEAERLKQLKKE